MLIVKKQILLLRMISVILVIVMTTGIVGCSVKQTMSGGIESAVIWYAPGTQKIRPDVEAKNYDSIKLSGLNVKTGRSEYESAQIIITASKDIKSYDLKVSDLFLETDSGVKFSSENITVYNEHYIECTEVFEGSELTTPGFYPDGLIPFKAAKEYGENKVSKGENQGIWVTFYAPSGQIAGTYTGTFTLELDGEEEKIPVNLKIWDVDFAENYTAKNCFLIDWACFSYSELDTSQDMYNAYANALLEYRLQPDLIMNDLSTTNIDDMAYYAQQALNFAQDKRCTVLFLPFAYNNRSGDTNLDETAMKNWIRSFVDASINSYGTEKQMNMVKKTMIYFTIIDEPYINTGLIPRTNRVTADLARFRSEVKQEYLTKLASTSGLSKDEYAFRLEVINAIDNISHVLTGMKDDQIEGVEVYCPPIHTYDSEEERIKYVNDKERWWYTCVGPHYPYPTYHIDDTNGLLSSRIMSWMQSDYDVIGNLYWSTNMYMNATGGALEIIENPYTDSAQRFKGANGDGYLFYPGDKYGIDGPVGTIRIHAIRDGLEEYETLEAMKDIYSNINDQLEKNGKPENLKVDFSNVYSLMKESLYTGCSAYTTQEYYDNARELLMNLAELAGMGGVLTDIQNGEIQSEIKVVLPCDLKVKYDGGTIITEKIGDNVLYTFVQPRSDSNRTFDCIVTDGKKDVAIKINLGGEVKQYSADKLVSSVSVGTRELSNLTSADIVSGLSVDAVSGKGNWLHVKLPQADGKMQQNMVISDSDLFENIGSNTNKMTVKLYYNSDKAVDNEGALPFTIQFRYENDTYYSYVREAKLNKGYNDITVGNMFAYDWKKTGKLKDVRIIFGDKDSPAENQLYLIGIDVYTK